MFRSTNDEYIKATKNARVNTYDTRDVSVRLGFINFSLFSLLIIGSYYSYFYFNRTNHKNSSTIVMGVNHMNASDNDLMVSLYDIEVDKITVEKETLSISDAMKNIIDNSSLDNDIYVEEFATKVELIAVEKAEKITFEKRILDELKLIN